MIGSATARRILRHSVARGVPIRWSPANRLSMGRCRRRFSRRPGSQLVAGSTLHPEQRSLPTVGPTPTLMGKHVSPIRLFCSSSPSVPLSLLIRFSRFSNVRPGTSATGHACWMSVEPLRPAPSIMLCAAYRIARSALAGHKASRRLRQRAREPRRLLCPRGARRDNRLSADGRQWPA